jgi:hypothetical protein
MTHPPNKFDWLKAVYAHRGSTKDDRFTDGEKSVLAYVAIFGVLNGSDTFCTRQSTIAANCGSSLRTVSSAITRGKDLGYLTVTRTHKPGWGCHGADELRLTLPKSCADYAYDSTEWSADYAHDSGESYAPIAPSHVQDMHIHKEERVFNNGSLKEAGVDSSGNMAAGNNSRPPPCPKHPDGTKHDQPCRRCMEIRKWNEQHKADRLERQRQQRRAAKAVIEACGICDGTGWVEADNDAVRKCVCKTDSGKAEGA